jgi:hypothetical protein
LGKDTKTEYLTLKAGQLSGTLIGMAGKERTLAWTDDAVTRLGSNVTEDGETWRHLNHLIWRSTVPVN